MYGLLGSALVMLITTAIGRSSLGADQARSSRYVYLLAVMLIPRKQGREFKTPVTFDLAYAENPEAKLVAKAVHIGALKPDPEATWKNVDIAREATLLDGKVEATLVKKGKLWKLDMTLKDLKMPSGIDGMEGRTLDEIRVEAYLAKDETLTPELPAMPDWYKRPE